MNSEKNRGLIIFAVAPEITEVSQSALSFM